MSAKTPLHASSCDGKRNVTTPRNALLSIGSFATYSKSLQQIVAEQQDSQREKARTAYRKKRDWYKQERLKVARKGGDRGSAARTRFDISRGEMMCSEQLAALTNDTVAAENARLQYNFTCHAHRLFANGSAPQKAASSKTNSATQTANVSERRLQDSAMARQFAEHSSVPHEQRASVMWAHALSVMEKCNEAERHFPALNYLFHRKASGRTLASQDEPQLFSCTERCADAAFDALLGDQSCVATQERVADAHARCVAKQLFAQFYVPICFARRNAVYKNTCISDSWSNKWSLAAATETDDAETPGENATEEERCAFIKRRSDAQIAREQETNLFDIQLLPIDELLHLALAPLEHCGAMFPYGPLSAGQLKCKASNSRASNGATTLAAADARTAEDEPIPPHCAPAMQNVYDRVPEAMHYRCKNDSYWNRLYTATKQADASLRATYGAEDEQFNVARQRAESKITNIVDKRQKAMEQAALDQLIAEHHNRVLLRNECSRDGVHDAFSEERIEVYQTTLRPNRDQASAHYARFVTKYPKRDVVRCKSAQLALDKFVYKKVDLAKSHVPSTAEMDRRATETAQFVRFCATHNAAILQDLGAKQVLFDEALTLRLYAAYRLCKLEAQSAKDSEHADETGAAARNLTALLGDKKLAENVRGACLEHTLSQAETPNFRAWGACVLGRLDAWLDDLLVSVLRPASTWFDKRTRQKNSSVVDGGGGVHSTTIGDEQEYADFAATCRRRLPWLFDVPPGENQTQSDGSQTPLVFGRRKLIPLDDIAQRLQEYRSLDRQHRANCRRQWSLTDAIGYFNREIVPQRFCLGDNKDASLTTERTFCNSGDGRWSVPSPHQVPHQQPNQLITSAVSTNRIDGQCSGECVEEADVLGDSNTYTQLSARVDSLVMQATRTCRLSADNNVSTLRSFRTMLREQNKRNVEDGADRQLLWTICCEPLGRGRQLFSSRLNRGAHAGQTVDPTDDALFGASKVRDLQLNPYVQFHEHVWQVLQNEWRQDDHDVLPDVAHFVDRVVRIFGATRHDGGRNVTTRRDSLLGANIVAQNDEHDPGSYLTVSQSKRYVQSGVSVDDKMTRESVAARLRRIVDEFGAHFYQPRFGALCGNSGVHLCTDGSDPITVAEQRTLDTLRYDIMHTSKRTFHTNPYSFSRPHTTLAAYCLSLKSASSASAAKCDVSASHSGAKIKAATLKKRARPNSSETPESSGRSGKSNGKSSGDGTGAKQKRAKLSTKHTKSVTNARRRTRSQTKTL